jgi:hypothetical protein
MKPLPNLRLLVLAGVALLSAGMFAPVRAQADPGDLQRGVARISLMNGEVSVKRGDSGDWVAGVLNAPLMAGDSIATSPNSRAEVEFDSSNALRIDGDAEVRLAQLEYGRYQLDIARGTVTYRVLRQTDANMEVDTPNVSVKPLRPGAYRIAVSDAGETEVTARSGSVEVITPTGSQWVNTGQTMQARGDASTPEFRFVDAIALDDWDRWNDARDHTEMHSASNGYVPAGVYGAEDLDAYGNWVYEPDYGYCWQPVVAAGWAPYSMGRWSWLDWYGWTWVGADPWGWAPYHYGRWFYRTNHWYWYPGSAFALHYWSPGLVSFFGWGGGGVGIGFGYGNIGWVPLAPYEVFHPWWGRRFYGHPDLVMRNINIRSASLTNIYANSRVAGGVTGLRSNDFESGRFHDLTHYSGTQIGRAGVLEGAVPIAPGSGNLRFTDRQSAVTPRAVANARFAARQQAAPVDRIPFAQQQRGFTQAGILNRSGSAGGPAPAARAAAPAPNALRPPNPAPQQAQPGGWRQVGDAGSRAIAPPPSPNAAVANRAPSQAPAVNEPAGQPNRGGWQRFGTPGSPAPAAPRAPAYQQAPQAQQPDRSGWNRFGSPGTTRTEPRPQAAPPSYGGRDNVPRYSAPPAPRQEMPRYSAPPAPMRSAPPASSGGGGSSAPRSSGGGGGGDRGGARGSNAGGGRFR